MGFFVLMSVYQSGFDPKQVLGSHLELQQAVKTHFALKLSHYNLFFQNRAFKEFFWLRSDSSKVVLIPNQYLNI